MKNYIVINGVTYDLVKREGETEIVPGTGLIAGPKLADFTEGDTVKIGNHEMIVLEHINGTTLLLR